MFGISMVDDRSQRGLTAEGMLIDARASELKIAYDQARSDLRDRELMIDVNNITRISQAGENFLLELMKEGVTFRSRGVFTKHVLVQLARRVRNNGRESTI
jgi:anti-anti-sigma regulatory factor